MGEREKNIKKILNQFQHSMMVAYILDLNEKMGAVKGRLETMSDKEILAVLNGLNEIERTG